jgi:hypothetical protein
MAKIIPDPALAALLSFEDEKDKVSAESALPTLNQREDVFLRTDSFVGLLREGALPTLNERVELFLRAEYGEGLLFTDSERAEARARILDAMAVDAQARPDLLGLLDLSVAVRAQTEDPPSGIPERFLRRWPKVLDSDRSDYRAAQHGSAETEDRQCEEETTIKKEVVAEFIRLLRSNRSAHRTVERDNPASEDRQPRRRDDDGKRRGDDGKRR